MAGRRGEQLQRNQSHSGGYWGGYKLGGDGGEQEAADASCSGWVVGEVWRKCAAEPALDAVRVVRAKGKNPSAA